VKVDFESEATVL